MRARSINCYFEIKLMLTTKIKMDFRYIQLVIAVLIAQLASAKADGEDEGEGLSEIQIGLILVLTLLILSLLAWLAMWIYQLREALRKERDMTQRLEEINAAYLPANGTVIFGGQRTRADDIMDDAENEARLRHAGMTHEQLMELSRRKRQNYSPDHAAGNYVPPFPQEPPNQGEQMNAVHAFAPHPGVQPPQAMHGAFNNMTFTQNTNQ